jgi:hypothetical protein
VKVVVILILRFVLSLTDDNPFVSHNEPSFTRDDHPSDTISDPMHHACRLPIPRRRLRIMGWGIQYYGLIGHRVFHEFGGWQALRRTLMEEERSEVEKRRCRKEPLDPGNSTDHPRRQESSHCLRKHHNLRSRNESRATAGS